MAVVEEQRTYLKDGDEYKESLRDGREVYYRGERIDDVTHAGLLGQNQLRVTGNLS